MYTTVCEKNGMGRKIFYRKQKIHSGTTDDRDYGREANAYFIEDINNHNNTSVDCEEYNFQ